MNVQNMSPATSAARECWHSTLQLAVREVFELMLGSSLEVPAQPAAEDGLAITAMVGMAGQLCGVLSVRCSEKSAARVASQMLGVDMDKCGPEMWDALGEVSNMIAGNFKNKIAGLGDGCMLSVPTVISGGDYNLRSLVNEEIRAVLLFQGEPLIVCLELHN
jgi:chemotaxis protein CheX